MKGKPRQWLIFLLLVLLFDALLPVIAAPVLAARLQRQYHWQVEELTLRSWPGAALLAGRFDKVSLLAAQVPTSKVTLSQVRLEAVQGRVDLGRIWRGEGARLETAEDVVLEAAIGEEELAAFLTKTVRNLQKPEVAITPVGIELKGEYAGIPVMARGKIVAEGAVLRFAAEQFTAGGLRTRTLPGFSLVEIVIADLAAGKLPLTVRSVQLEKGRIVVSASGRQ